MLSIITPTYNRCDLLERLYENLIIQTSKNFEWIIVDDGSTDNTNKVVKHWINQNKVNIKYIYQENRGKYIAHNTGVKNSNGELCLCIDSDDYPTIDCVETILRYWELNKKEKYAGIIALKSYSNQQIIGGNIPNSLKETTLFELSEKYKLRGDRTLIYRSDILKEHLFPEISGVKFITECVIYDEIDKKNKLLVLNKNLCICEYQENGYSNNFLSLMFKNPVGFNIYYMQRIDMALNIIKRIEYAAKYNAFKWMSKSNNYKYRGKHKIVVKASLPLSILFYLYYQNKKRKLKI